MKRIPVAFALSLAAVGAGCADNDAPGNDREAALEPAHPAAEMVTAGEALNGVSTGLLQPEIITDADLRTLGAPRDRCVFRFTRIGFPVFVFGSDAGVIKLNGKLVRLPASGDGRYSENGVSVTQRPLDGQADAGPYAAELVLRLEGAPNELGFHGYAEC